jgi:hypothetical protein
MPTSLTAAKLLDREFLSIRSKLIDLAASLDRIQGTVPIFASAKMGLSPLPDTRIDKIAEAVRILAGQTPNRTEQIQILFSLPYDEHWQT